MLRRAHIALLIAWLGLVVAPAAMAEKRALVIGIDRYDHLAPQHQLQRAVNDARAVSAELGLLGYDVMLSENPTRPQFNEIWQSFLDRIARGDQVAFFFAGHGVEIDSQNFLLPRDIPMVRAGRQEQLRREALNLSEFLLDLRSKKPQVSLFILDACRDSPFGVAEGRSLSSSSSGLAGIKDPPEGTFIMYSAGAGETALDRLPDEDPTIPNSIYTRRLLPLLRTPGLTMPEMAQRLRAEVRQLAGRAQHLQTPAYYDGLVGQYCLATCEKPLQVARSDADTSSGEAHAWETAVVAANTAAYAKYIELYPRGRFAAEARAAIAQLDVDVARAQAAETERRRVAAAEDAVRRAAAAQEAADTLDWARAQSANRLDGYRDYLRNQPSGRFVEQARAQVRHRETLAGAWTALGGGRNLVRLKAFVDDAQGTEFAAAAKIRLDELEELEGAAWRDAERSRLLREYESFLVTWPEGFFAVRATSRVAELVGIRQQWTMLKGSDDEAKLEAFVHSHGWSEFGADATARLVALRRERATPDTGTLKTLNANELRELLSGAQIRFTSTAETITMSWTAMPSYRTTLGRDFLKKMMKGEDVAAEGTFSASGTKAGPSAGFEGLGAVVRSRVDQSGSLFLLQIHGSEKTPRDVDQRDRQFRTLQIVQDVFGTVCITTKWMSIMATTSPEKMPERCTVEKKGP